MKWHDHTLNTNSGPRSCQSLMSYFIHLSEEGAIEGHSEEAIHRPHGNVQVHQKPLLLQSVDCGTNPLGTQTSQIGLPVEMDFQLDRLWPLTGRSVSHVQFYPGKFTHMRRCTMIYVMRIDFTWAEKFKRRVLCLFLKRLSKNVLLREDVSRADAWREEKQREVEQAGAVRDQSCRCVSVGGKKEN